MEQDKLILIDTSIWIEALRTSGAADIRERVREVMVDGLAAWCDIIVVELWNGARGSYEKKKLSELEKEITCLPTTKEAWALARKLARACRESGKTVPAADLIIASCALFHKVKIDHCDSHIDNILKVHQTLPHK